MDFTSLFADEEGARDFDEGDMVFEEGDDGTEMYFVREGAVELMHRGKVVERVEAGGLFGEMALLDASVRSATAIVRAPTQLVPIARPRFERMVQQTPLFALHIMQLLADRLRAMNEAD